MMFETGILERLRGDARSFLELGINPLISFKKAKMSPIYSDAYRKDKPLVSICTTTYNRSKLLIERSVRSSLEQSYPNVEIIVIGDGCTDDTELELSKIKDSRFTFINRPERGKYSSDPRFRWLMAGADAFNHALELAKGDFITHLDDDDTHTPDRIAKLVDMLKSTRADIIYHPFSNELGDGEWKVLGGGRFQLGQITSSSIIYNKWFTRFPADKESIVRYNEPGDWNRMRKMRYVGANIRRHPDAMLNHFAEQLQYGR